MKLSKIGCILVLSVMLALLIPLFPTPAHAAEYLFLYPYEGEIGDYFEISGTNFNEHDIVFIYLSSTKAAIGDAIDEDITAYEQIAIAYTDETGDFDRTYSFFLPDALTDGTKIEDVHDGSYYIYATYFRSYYIIARTGFVVTDGEISLDIEEGIVGTEVEISGVGLRPNQQITINFDGNNIGIVTGDSQTDNNGNFTCTVIIPESSAGKHTISAVDESGDTPDAEFTIEPQLTIDPVGQEAGGELNIRGSGFGERENLTVTIDGEKVDTTPSPLTTDHGGNFEGDVIVPFIGSYGTREIAAMDESYNKDTAQLSVWGGIYLSPLTSSTSPGYVGMELVIHGAGFTAGATVTITYSNNDDTIPVASLVVDEGTFWEEFFVPPSLAGSHDITATDGTSTATAVFTMESQAPPTPMPLTPEVASTAGEIAYFDWEDVSDDSGISYTLQLAIDVNFNTVLLEKAGLTTSEYTLTEEERLEPVGEETSYYWRVKAVDGASNESGWTHPHLFYVGFSWTSLPSWVWYILVVIVVVVLGTIGHWLWKKKARAKIRAS